MRELETKHLLNLREILQGRNLITVSVGFCGTPVILSLDKTPDYRDPNGHVKLRSDSINYYRISYFLGEVLKHVDLPPTRQNYHDIQPMGSDRWLVVHARANYHDKNAHIYSSCGELIHSFRVRDGVEDIQVTETGQIWITSDCGSRTELVCLDETGNFIFKYSGESPSIHSSLYTLFCYAMNVASRDIWTHWDTAYYSNEFSLVHISNFEIRREYFPFPLRYSHAFAVNKEYHALFDGDYGDYALFTGDYYKPDSLFLVSLDTKEFQELIPVDQSGKQIKSFRAFGRGPRLFLYTDDTLSIVRLDIDDW